MKLFTIGFTKKSAETFFTRLQAADVKRLIDVRLNNVSQLAGFTKKDDLRYFCNAICQIEYVHLHECAPTQEMLDRYKKQKGSWASYEEDFIKLMETRRIEVSIPQSLIDTSCLLCSEPTPDQCHRRLVAEYLKSKWGDIEIHHLI